MNDQKVKRSIPDHTNIDMLLKTTLTVDHIYVVTPSCTSYLPMEYCVIYVTDV